MTEKQFTETYCLSCGTQRCEGIGTEWFEGCRKRWNLDGVDAATEVERLNNKIIELGAKILKLTKRGKWESRKKFSEHFGAEVVLGYKCSLCGFQIETKTNYCPECGACMDGGNNERILSNKL